MLFSQQKLKSGLILALITGAATLCLQSAASAQSVPLRGPLASDEQAVPNVQNEQVATPLNLSRYSNEKTMGARNNTTRSLAARNNTNNLSQQKGQREPSYRQIRTQPQTTNALPLPTNTPAEPLNTGSAQTRAQPLDARVTNPYRSTQSRRRAPTTDPYAPLGIEASSLILYPAIEIGGGYDTNASRARNGDGAAFLQARPELKVQSDWVRHSLNADLRSSYTRYLEGDDTDRPTLNATINGVIDATKTLKFNAGLSANIQSEGANNADLPANAAERPSVYTTGASLGATQTFNRLSFDLRGSVERSQYDDVKLINGTKFSNDDRNRNTYGVRLRTGYEIHPGLMPFVEVGMDQRKYDDRLDRNNLARSSKGYAVRVGSTYEITRLITAEASVGYGLRNYDDATLRDLKGISTDFTLTWTPTQLTTVKLRGTTALDETTLLGSSGSVSRTVELEATHALRTNVSLTPSISYTRQDYQGLNRTDDFIRTMLRTDYKLSREMSVFGSYGFEHLSSSAAGQDYNAHIFLMGMRFQR